MMSIDDSDSPKHIGKAGKLDFFASTFYGFFFGFALGVGCSLVVLYAIYSGGYRKALEDSLREPKPDRYLRLLAGAANKIAAEPGSHAARKI